MIISRTPFRISFFGGGTDYPTWLDEHEGSILSTTIDKYCYISCRELPPFFDHKYCLVYSNIEYVKNIDDIQHPAVKGVLKWMNWDSGLGVHYDGDLPARSGLGSSSAFTVGLIHSLSALRGNFCSKKSLALNAVHIEQKQICEVVGSQDQIAAAYGGMNRIEFLRGGEFEVTPITLNPEKSKSLNSHLMLFFTGVSRFASEIAKTKIENFRSKEKTLLRMKEMVSEAIDILHSNRAPISDFGDLLHEGWMLKKSLSDAVSTDHIDSIYAKATESGAVGGKILGAGGGGFLLLFAAPEFHVQIREALIGLVEVPFKFESGGSRIIFSEK
jgi:D-glycero-alpha-D-manno-heptose-7-phosphate kinase